jgi:protein-S-isoprenylcysteine O-methyltransferase Ste14
MIKLLLIALCWVFFGTLHSALLHMPTKERIQEYLEIDDQSYRLMYSLVSVLSLFIATAITLFTNGTFVKQPDGFTYLGGGLLILGSLYLLRKSFKNYSLMIFIGLQPDNVKKLEISGMNRFVRHPLYLSSILLLIGIIVFWPSDVVITACVVMMVYTVIGARLEERKLINQFGKEYTDYMKEVPGLIPRFWEK